MWLVSVKESGSALVASFIHELAVAIIGSEAARVRLAVEIEPAFGLGASFTCLRIEVGSANRCDGQGRGQP